MAATGKPSAFVGRLDKVSQAISAVTRLLEGIASLLRQLVHIAGWVILLIGAVKLLVNPHPLLEHLVLPGAGVLAILQSWVKPRRRGEETTISPVETPQLDVDPMLTEVDASDPVEAQAEQMTDL